MQKKENAKLKDEMGEFKNVIKDLQQNEEEIDIQAFVQEPDQTHDPARQSKTQFQKMSSQAKLGGGTASNWNVSHGAIPSAPNAGLPP